jgi:heme A synthase
MWGIFVGFAIGVLQVAALYKLIKIMLGQNAAMKMIAVMLLMVKIAAIVGILYLLSTVSVAHLIWAAGGMLIGLICASVFMLRQRNKTDREGTHVE